MRIMKRDLRSSGRQAEQADRLLCWRLWEQIQPRTVTPVGGKIEELITATEGVQYVFRWDSTTTSNVIYFGEALPGAASSAASWRIQRINTSTEIDEWADGDSDFDNIWDNRASLSYS